MGLGWYIGMVYDGVEVMCDGVGLVLGWCVVVLG